MTGLTKSILWVLITRVHRTNPTRLCLYVNNVCVLSKLCPTRCDPRDCSSPGSSVHWIFQARILQRVAISSHDSCVSYIDRQILYHWVTSEAPKVNKENLKRWNSLMVWFQNHGGVGWEGEKRTVSFHKMKKHYHLVITRNSTGPTTYNDYLQRPDDAQNRCWQRNSNVGLFSGLQS